MSSNVYNLTTAPEGKWSAEFPIPAIGDRVKVVINGFGVGTVESYFVEHGYVGVAVKLESPPAWRDEQLARKGKPTDTPALVFGREIEPQEAAA